MPEISEEPAAELLARNGQARTLPKDSRPNATSPSIWGGNSAAKRLSSTARRAAGEREGAALVCRPTAGLESFGALVRPHCVQASPAIAGLCARGAVETTIAGSVTKRCQGSCAPFCVQAIRTAPSRSLSICSVASRGSVRSNTGARSGESSAFVLDDAARFSPVQPTVAAARVRAVGVGAVLGHEGELSAAWSTLRAGAPWCSHPGVLGTPPGPQLALDAVALGSLGQAAVDTGSDGSGSTPVDGGPAPALCGSHEHAG